jgi:uncharacterized membrane protein
MLGRLVNSFVGDANSSLVWISVVSGALGVAAIYLLGRSVFNHRVGLLAALLTLTSPLHWFYSEVALSYALEFVCVIVIVGLCFMQWKGKRGVWPWAAVALGIAGGIRQNDLVFLFPLWLASLIPLSGRQRIASLALLGGVAPMLALSGGITGYLTVSRAESTGIVAGSPLSSVFQLVMNGGRIIIFLGYAILLGAVFLLGTIIPLIRSRRKIVRDIRTWWFILWIAPALFFYFFVHIRQQGHIFTFLPAAFLLTAYAVVWTTQRITLKLSPRISSILIGLIFIINITFFLAVPQSLLNSSQLALQTPSRRSISNRDQFLKEHIYTIRAYFDPASTAILAGDYYFRHPDFYLSNFQFVGLSHTLTNEKITLPKTIHTLVFFDNQAILPGIDPTIMQTFTLPDGSNLSYITWSENQHVLLSKTTIQFLSP